MMANGDVGIGSWNCGRDGEYRERITFRREDILLPVTGEVVSQEARLVEVWAYQLLALNGYYK